jgi:hypothetical protein
MRLGALTACVVAFLAPPAFAAPVGDHPQRMRMGVVPANWP